jgi:nucleoid-associated protein YgaU
MADANLKIIAYDSPGGGRTTNEVGTFTVDFNPATFAITNKIEYKKTEAKGQDGGDPQFDKIPPLEFTIDFTIDGTGINPASGHNRDYVKNQIKELRNITGCNINGEIHRPNYLAVLWGTFYIECVLTALNITYNLFDRDGTPIRAKVNCGFLERIGAGKGGRKSRLESPDLTRFVTIKDGDRLPLLAKGKYGDPAYYIQLAKVNKLKNLRHLATGTQIVLPPMAD